MASIMFEIVGIWISLFKCNYLKNKKDFLIFLFHWWNLHHILKIFEKNMILTANAFPRLHTVKTALGDSLKSAVSKDPLAVNMLEGNKHLWNLLESTFIIFFAHSEGKWLGKYLPYTTLKSLWCLLTHWLPIITIPLGILGICSSLFKCNYLKKEKLFLDFLFEMIVIANVLPKLQTVEDLIKPLSRKSHFRTSFGSKHVKGSPIVVKSAWEHFYHIS